MSLVRVKTKFQITIPSEILRELHLSVGDFLEAKVEAGKLVFTPKEVVDRQPVKTKKPKRNPHIID